MADDLTPQDGQDGNDEPNTSTVSPEVVAELQRQLDALTERCEKAENKAAQQEGRAKKAETLLKEKRGDAQEQIDELAQRLELAQSEVDKHAATVQQLTKAQTSAAITAAVAGVAPKLADGASNDLIALMRDQVGVKDGRVVVLTDKGTPRLSGATGTEMKVAELCEEMVGVRHYLQRSTSGGGSGGAGNTGGTGKQTITRAQFEEMDSYDRAKAWQAMSKEQKAAMSSEGG